MATHDEFERAEARAQARRAKYPQVEAARFDTGSKKIVLSLSNGLDVAFPASNAQGLEGATQAALKKIEVSPSGYGLHFPALDADIYVPALLDGLMGSKRWAAAQLGALGGKASSEAKATASRANGKLGGRPRKRA